MKKRIIKIIILVLIAGAAVYAYHAFNIKQYLDLEYLKGARENLVGLYENNRLLVIAVYFAVYVVAAAVSIPGALIITLAGGAIFGFIIGTIVVSFASTIGATLAFSVSRFLLKDWVQNKFGDRLKAVNSGLEKEGAFYLFTLRLIPIFPFWIINLVMGVTKIRLFTFYWVSQLGMLAGTMVYVNAGKELSKVKSLSFTEFFSPGMIISLILIGLFPITVKKLMGLYRKKIMKEDPAEQ